jgi:hypothetical protein
MLDVPRSSRAHSRIRGRVIHLVAVLMRVIAVFFIAMSPGVPPPPPTPQETVEVAEEDGDAQRTRRRRRRRRARRRFWDWP